MLINHIADLYTAIAKDCRFLLEKWEEGRKIELKVILEPALCFCFAETWATIRSASSATIPSPIWANWPLCECFPTELNLKELSYFRLQGQISLGSCGENLGKGHIHSALLLCSPSTLKVAGNPNFCCLCSTFLPSTWKRPKLSCSLFTFSPKWPKACDLAIIPTLPTII